MIHLPILDDHFRCDYLVPIVVFNNLKVLTFWFEVITNVRFLFFIIILFSVFLNSQWDMVWWLTSFPFQFSEIEFNSLGTCLHSIPAFNSRKFLFNAELVPWPEVRHSWSETGFFQLLLHLVQLGMSTRTINHIYLLVSFEVLHPW